ncbi:MAG: agmatinase [Thermoanaerobaculia bacterium]|nr:agmatinase [Thermoanaerobaculia bacterium]
MTDPTSFFDLPDEHSEYDSARTAILPIPYERTTSYGQGTSLGPAAIHAASMQVEFWEEMTRSEPYLTGIATLPSVACGQATPEEVVENIRTAARSHLEAGKFLVSLGGEHAVSVGLFEAVRDVHGPIGVVQFDAHADLRQSYQGSELSHACIMHRALDAEHPTLAVGIRALCKEESDLIDRRALPTIWGWELADAKASFESHLDSLPETVYLTFDVDYFDPTVMPATGTPVPGGGEWYPTLELLEVLFRRKRVLAMDVVELAPRPDLHACDFLTASLIYKCLAFEQRAGNV